ncbi:MAG: hypothetical protein D6796_16255, partial [Caldilineae bacterium]
MIEGLRIVDTTIANLVLDDLHIACALTNRQLTVTEVYGAVRYFCLEDRPCVGCSLYEVVPELVGSEEVIAQILSGTLPRYELAWVNRESGDGDLRYLNITLLPHRNAEGDIIG